MRRGRRRRAPGRRRVAPGAAVRRSPAARAAVRSSLLVVRGTADDTLPEGWRKLAAGSTGGVLTLGPLDLSHISELGLALGVAMTPAAARPAVGAHARQPAVRPRGAAGAPGRRQLAARARVRSRYRSRTRSWCAGSSTDATADVVALIEAAAVLGVRAPLHAVVELAGVEDPLETLDAAVESGLVRLDDRATGAFVEFSHPLARAAIYEAMPNARRSALNGAAAGIVRDAVAAMRHRVEAATITNDALLADLEEHAHDEMARGAWSSAVSSLIAASRLTPVPADRERLALEAIEAMLYSGDGAAARRLADQTGFADGPRRDSVLAYLAMFAGDLEAAQRLLDTRVGAARGRRRRAARRDDRPAQRLPRHRPACAAARRSSGRSGRWRWRRAIPPPDCSSHRRWRSASASSAASGRPCRARPLARRSRGAAARRRLRPARAEGLPAPRRRRRARRHERRSRPRPPRASSAACSWSPRCRSPG